LCVVRVVEVLGGVGGVVVVLTGDCGSTVSCFLGRKAGNGQNVVQRLLCHLTSRDVSPRGFARAGGPSSVAAALGAVARSGPKEAITTVARSDPRCVFIKC
jgi:hypothetical protein